MTWKVVTDCIGRSRSVDNRVTVGRSSRSVQAEVQREIEQAGGEPRSMGSVERFAFYEPAKQAYCVVAKRVSSRLPARLKMLARRQRKVDRWTVGDHRQQPSRR